MKRPAVGKIQMAYNMVSLPQTIKKEIRDLIAVTKAVAKEEDKKSISIASSKQERRTRQKLEN